MDLLDCMALLVGGAVGIFAVSAGWGKWSSRTGGKRRDDVSRETSFADYLPGVRPGWCLLHTDGPVWHDTSDRCTP